MAEPSATAASKVEEILTTLEKSYGKVHALPEERPLDHAVYLLLRDNWDYRKAQKALGLLQEEFVDWNEVRVSTAGELCGVLGPLGDRDLEVKVEKLRTLLEYIWRECNCVHLDFLAERDPERQVRFLEGPGVLTAGQVQVVLQALCRDELLVSPHSVRLLNRIGLMPRVYSDSGARKNLSGLLGEGDLYRFQSHLVQHGEEVCVAKSPHCSECALVNLCEFKRKVGVVGA